MDEGSIWEWSLLEPITKYAAHLVPEEDALEIAEITYVRMMHKDPHLHNNFNFARHIAKFVAIDWLRRERRQALLNSADIENIENSADQNDPYATSELWISLRAALSKEEVQVIILSFDMDMTLAEIAAWLNKPLTTIASIKKRALVKARDALRGG